ncbi:hypothetical protein [Streptomyces bobili]|uniref:hypothetical protein n=1 Tax=Streptomyces bobili TaxID=67280 RepID=UPI000A3AF61E|nr:hypothetical protein [Streptomyces bobili]
MTDPKTVRGPMYIEATPLMVTADVEPLVHANVGELLDLLAGEFFEDFMEIADPSCNGGEPADRLQYERLQARLVDRMSTKVALTGPQAMRVAGRMAKLGKPLADLSAKTAAAVMKGASLIKHPTHAATRRHLKSNPLPGQQDRRAS